MRFFSASQDRDFLSDRSSPGSPTSSTIAASAKDRPAELSSAPCFDNLPDKP
jgi:hypothetical protein